FIYDVTAFALELEVYEGLFNTAVLISFTWVMAKTIKLVSWIIYRRYDYQLVGGNNIKERRIHTQALFLEKILVVVVWVLGLSFALLTVEQVKGVGTKLLASAGILSVVVGFAAQKGLANLIAGFQIAFTQPIRIDDVVFVEGEWGRIEEITLTYVVVKIWDWRRLVLPVTYFTQRPFQNWTRSSSDLLGNITFWADYTLDVQALREALDDIMKSSELYNGDFWNLQVVETSDKAMQLRILMTADDSPTSWDLRCEIREKVLQFIRETQPQALPTMRFEGIKSDNQNLETNHFGSTAQSSHN
ncbi:MAG: mechanosensitive ion channel, partial [Bacteriovoracaceae bacterium]|nr:mechanosensitive ion channel [Bacteriovoracaceae bacterium]